MFHVTYWCKNTKKDWNSQENLQENSFFCIKKEAFLRNILYLCTHRRKENVVLIKTDRYESILG